MIFLPCAKWGDCNKEYKWESGILDEFLWYFTDLMREIPLNSPDSLSLVWWSYHIIFFFKLTVTDKSRLLLLHVSFKLTQSIMTYCMQIVMFCLWSLLDKTCYNFFFLQWNLFLFFFTQKKKKKEKEKEGDNLWLSIYFILVNSLKLFKS